MIVKVRRLLCFVFVQCFLARIVQDVGILFDPFCDNFGIIFEHSFGIDSNDLLMQFWIIFDLKSILPQESGTSLFSLFFLIFSRSRSRRQFWADVDGFWNEVY